MMNYKYYFLILTNLIINNQILKSQTDTEFWFVAPEVSDDGRGLDKPIYLRVSTFDEASNVIITQPANSSFAPINISIPANSLETVNLTSRINMIENKPANAILNYGIKIESSANITCYYEVSGDDKNPEIFVLKGKNALGRQFYIPSQTSWNNNIGYTPIPKNAFDIVATEDNTNITVMPNSNIVGHSAGITFNITLNQGQTYSATAQSYLASNHLAGSWILADKDIAITIKDDLISLPVYCNDLMGDQLIPVDKVGTEYVAVKGGLNLDRVFITATQNNTPIYLNGSTAPTSTIQEGETLMISLVNNYTYITTGHPAYVLHTSGSGCEVAQAILPPLRCTGSEEVRFVNSDNDFLMLNIIVKNGHQNDFLLNNNPLTNAIFTPVAGTSGEWVATRLPLNLVVNQAHSLKNTSEFFQLGVLNGGALGTGCRYGYFSNYNEQTLSLSDTLKGCPTDALTLDAGTGFNTYLWNNGATTQTIEVSESGVYSVEVSTDCGIQTKSFIVNIKDELSIDLGADIELNCDSSSTILDAGVGFDYYLWDTGVEDRYLEVNQEGTYSVLVRSGNCETTDEIKVNFNNLETELFIPNVITPSIKDGKNDFFIIPQELLGTKLKVYNRWGNLVYKDDNYQNNWDANNIKTDLLFYTIEHDNSCYTNPIKGNLSILK